jgi:hypothetical protein
MTPLGLHVISPVPPAPPGPLSPIRSVGFSPSYQPSVDAAADYAMDAARRGSSTSTSSTLTQTRPSYSSYSSYPSGFITERRRSSLSPSTPTLTGPLPTRAHAKGRLNSRPTSSDGAMPPPMQAKGKAVDHASKPFLSGPSIADEVGRRGSMPQLQYGGWAGPSLGRVWNPSLPTARASMTEDDHGPEEGYRFGSGAPSSSAGPSAAAASLKNLDLSPGSRRSSTVSKKRLDVFAETEAEEAERQRKAFIDATFGQDGRRARERLSFAAPSTSKPASPGTAAHNLRRQSLALWEKINMTASASRPIDSPRTVLTDPLSLPSLSAAESMQDLAPRRGSLPVAIPGGGLGRSESMRGDFFEELARSRGEGEEEEGLASFPDANGYPRDFDGVRRPRSRRFPNANVQNTLSPPQRPLPPLLPLSDPGPRLLPSTLALHRANHLLNSRNLQADPLPHPLPPSLHPPAPVDLAEFDIDFILAGSQAQLGGDKKSPNAPIDILHAKPDSAALATPRLNVSGEEDTFAKFVGEFDDEYGGRRGEWTFRASSSRSSVPSTVSSSTLRAEWDCTGAGKYELYANGEVRSLQTGSVWRARKTGNREYELEEKNPGRSALPFTPPSPSASESATPDGCYVLAAKLSHTEFGGIKASSRTRAIAVSPLTHQLRVSISDQFAPERSNRLGSADSGATARPPPQLSSSLPLSDSMTPKRNRQVSREAAPLSDESLVPLPLSAYRGRGSISGPSTHAIANELKRREKDQRSASRDRLGESEDKKKSGGGGIGGALKRAFKSTISANDEKKAAREEKERERMQSQSWSPSISRSKDFIHPSGKGYETRSQTKTAPAVVSEKWNRVPLTGNGPKLSPGSLNSASSASERPKLNSHGSGGLEELPASRQGKAWNGVPDEAVAMVIPIEDEVAPVSALAPNQTRRAASSSRQALLVWYVPFNSDAEDRPATAASSSSSSHQSSDPATTRTPEVQPGSLPKLQKLLRRRASKDKDALKKDRDALVERLNGSAPGSVSNLHSTLENKSSCPLDPLPFRSFRVVARVVDMEDLRNEATPSLTSSSSITTSRTPSSHRAPSSFGSSQSPWQPSGSLPSTDENEVSSLSTAPTSTILAGRTFPTVLAVCHSHSQGVEFVLEGLDRLGFCQGESAWGPTGYEEWRGSGLSEKGRDLLDLLWAGCVGVMGLVDE